jgi:hypothetical protein
MPLDVYPSPERSSHLQNNTPSNAIAIRGVVCVCVYASSCSSELDATIVSREVRRRVVAGRQNRGSLTFSFCRGDTDRDSERETIFQADKDPHEVHDMNFSRQKAGPSVETTPVTQNDDDNWKQMEKIFVKVEMGDISIRGDMRKLVGQFSRWSSCHADCRSYYHRSYTRHLKSKTKNNMKTERHNT